MRQWLQNIKVTLTEQEIDLGTAAGLERMIRSEKNGWNHATVQQRSYLTRFKDERLEYCGEIAFCKVMGWEWVPRIDIFQRLSSVGNNCRIKTTSREDGSLIHRGNESLEMWYVLVTGHQFPEVIIRGRIRGKDCRQPEFGRDPHGHRPAWFVPQSALGPIPL